MLTLAGPGLKIAIRGANATFVRISSGSFFHSLTCHAASHNYQFTWEPNPNWAELFSPAAEIEEYLKHCVDKYDLGGSIKLRHAVTGAIWDDINGVWNVTVKDMERNIIFNDWCHFLLNASGILNNWRWPEIPGLHSFQGDLIHSANWPIETNLTGKIVAVIGNGSTGIQIVPAIQPYVKRLIHLIRSPTWVTPGAVSRYPSLRGDGTMPNKFSEEQKEVFRTDPGRYLEFRRQVELEINSKFKMLVNGAEIAEQARKNARHSMLELLGTRAADLGPDVIPDFAIGCRRITPGVGYLESFSKPNVQVITGIGIDSIESDGLVMTNGERLKVDSLICATGFDVSFTPRFPIIGRHDVSLDTLWNEATRPAAYLSLAVPEFPNYFSECSQARQHEVMPMRHRQTDTICSVSWA